MPHSQRHRSVNFSPRTEQFSLFSNQRKSPFRPKNAVFVECSTNKFSRLTDKKRQKPSPPRPILEGEHNPVRLGDCCGMVLEPDSGGHAMQPMSSFDGLAGNAQRQAQAACDCEGPLNSRRVFSTTRLSPLISRRCCPADSNGPAPRPPSPRPPGTRPAFPRFACWGACRSIG